MSDDFHLSRQVKSCFDTRDTQGLRNLMNRARQANLNSLDPGAQENDEQRKMEDQQLAEEFEIHIENLKNEAIKQFDKELYKECLGTFRFLCELDPDNRVLRDYLELCENLTGRVATSSHERGMSSNQMTEAFGSLNGLAKMEELAGDLPPEKSLGEKSYEHSSQSIPGDLPFGINNSEPTGLTGKTEILEIPEYDIHPAIGAQAGSESTRSRTLCPRPKKGTRFRPKSYLLVLSIAGILVLAAILGIPSLVHRRQDFPDSLEKQLNGGKGSESRQGTQTQSNATNPQTSLLEKADRAMSAGQYIRPANDNAFDYSNRALALDPQNGKARDLKNASLNHATDQARELARIGKTAEAREVFSSLLEMSQLEDFFPLSSQLLEGEIKKLEIVNYTVTHDHFLGSCRGLLRFNSYVITFEPFGEPNHKFSSSLTEIRLSEPGSKLKILVERRTYRFESGSGASNEEKRQKLRGIYQEITRRSGLNHG